MPKRLRVQKFLSTKVQGDDSWVRVSPLTVGEMRANRKQRKEKNFDAFDLGLTILKAHVVEWNWVDDDGEPLPQMPEHPEVVELLTDTEVAFLGDCIQGSEEAAKN